MELTEFLRARLDDLEALAERAADTASGQAFEFDNYGRLNVDPVFMAAQVEALRRIVALHTVHDDGITENGRRDEAAGKNVACRYYYCAECDHDRDYGFIGGPDEGCQTLRALASIWREHRDYDPAWKV